MIFLKIFVVFITLLRRKFDFYFFPQMRYYFLHNRFWVLMKVYLICQLIKLIIVGYFFSVAFLSKESRIRIFLFDGQSFSLRGNLVPPQLSIGRINLFLEQRAHIPDDFYLMAVPEVFHIQGNFPNKNHRLKTGLIFCLVVVPIITVVR